MKKVLCALLAAMMFIMSFCCVTFADEADDADGSWGGIVIDGIAFSLDYDTFKAKEEVYPSDISISVDSAELFRDPSVSLNKKKYQEGDVPLCTVKFEIEDKDSHIFARDAYYSRNITVYGGEPKTASLNSKRTILTVKVELREVDEADDPGWEPSGRGSGGGTSQGGPGDVPQEYIGAFLKDPNNGRYWYALPDGTRLYKKWIQVGGKWYYFDELGYMCQNSWLKWQEKWYFVGPEGDMWVNRRTPDGYYVDKNGVWDGKPRS